MNLLTISIALFSVFLTLPGTEAVEDSGFPENHQTVYSYLQHEPRNVDGLGLGGGNLIRTIQLLLKTTPEVFNRHQRNLDSLSGVTFGGSKRFDPSIPAYIGAKRSFVQGIDHEGFNGIIRKRNFDEIDRTGFDSFVRKRNFDEIDRAGFDGFVKRNKRSDYKHREKPEKK